MPKQILFVNPESKTGTLLETRLLAEGFKVLTVRDVEQAVTQIKKAAPDIVLWDCAAFNRTVSGELTRLRGFLTDKSPILLLSGLVSRDQERQAMEAGAFDILLRTMEVDLLCQRVRTLLEKPDKPQPVNPEKKKRLLIVDDEEDIRDLLHDFFGRKDFEIFEAADGIEALQIVKKENPSVVLLDVQMPGMNGIETLKEIRKLDPSMGVVMATANSDERITREAIMNGAYAYVIKPFDLPYLEMVVLTRLMTASQ